MWMKSLDSRVKLKRRNNKGIRKNDVQRNVLDRKNFENFEKIHFRNDLKIKHKQLKI